MENEDQILLDQLKQGETTAYGLLFHKYYKAMVTKAFFMLDDQMEAEDLVQNLFIVIWQKQHYHAIDTSIKAYLFRAVHNRCLTCIAIKKRTEQNYMEMVAQEPHEEETVQEFSEVYEQKLQLAFEELPLKRQQAVRLVHMQDKRYKQAAAEMGISVNSIKTHLRLALRVLQKKITNS